MHFSITAAFGGRLATLLKLAHQSQQLAAETGLSSSRARLKVLPQAQQESTCINLRTAPCSVTAGTSSPSNADTRQKILAGSSLVIQGLRMALLHAPNAAPFWNKLGFERQLQPCSILPQLTNAGCTVDTTSFAGFILELVLVVRRLVFTCVVNDRRPSFQRTPLATTSGPCVHSAPAALQSTGRVRELFPSCQGQQIRFPGAPMHQPSFARRTRQVQGRCKQLLRANRLVGDPTHPGYTSRTMLSGNRSEKTLELGPPPSRCNKRSSTPA